MTPKIKQWESAYKRSVGRLRKLESWPDTANKAQLIFKAGWDAALASHAPSAPSDCEGCRYGLATNHNLGPFCKLSEAAARPTDIGVDVAGGPDKTVFTCSICGSSETPCPHYTDF